jgi:amidase
VPQGRGIFPQLSVRDNLRFAWPRLPGDSEEEVIEAVLADFPRLAPLLDRMRRRAVGRRAAIAGAGALPDAPTLSLILLDEPTEGIQPSIIEEIVETLQVVKKRRESVDRAGGAELSISSPICRTGSWCSNVGGLPVNFPR